ncbi:MAG: L-histidine N(alpha)-methyltransferase [Friedmanniella sp.]
MSDGDTAVGGVLRSPDLRRAQLVRDVQAGLGARPRTLPSMYFYDARGSELFDQITRLPEYYPTRTERSILLAHAEDIAAATRAELLVELGSGTSEKTRLLLDALTAQGSLRRFVPLDVDPTVLADAAGQLRARYPGLRVEPVEADFQQPLPRILHEGPRLVAFLGSTVGNLTPQQRQRFLRGIADQLRPGDHFLLGVDLVKSPSRLVPAYDDAAGVTAEFNRNLLQVLNAELGADFEVEAYEHVVRWNAAEEWIEMWLRAPTSVTVEIPGAGLVLRLHAGEEIRTEISAKFRRDRLTAELASAGLEVVDWLTDPAEDFALTLSAPNNGDAPS